MTDCFEKISIMVSGIAAQLLQTSVHTGAAVISPGGRVVVVVVVQGFLVGGLSCLKCPNDLCDVPHCLACTL